MTTECVWTLFGVDSSNSERRERLQEEYVPLVAFAALPPRAGFLPAGADG